MTSLRLAAVLLALVCVTVALKCYTGNTENGKKPTATTECKGKYCLKVQKKDEKSAYYHCDTMNMCTKEGCVVDGYGDTKCCCSKQLCNSSTKLSALFSIVPIALMKLFV